MDLLPVFIDKVTFSFSTSTNDLLPVTYDYT